MCIIAYKPAEKNIDKATLKTCFKNNSDGAGFMFPCEGKVLIRKGYFSFPAFLEAWEKTEKIYGDSLPVVFHFRISTAGRVDKTNCHPHRISEDLAFVHNGILSCVDVPKKSKISDTIMYRNIHLRGMTGDSLRESVLFSIMGDHIGVYNKFVFMNGKGNIVFANEESGLWDSGIWFSNVTYKPAVNSPKYMPEISWNFCEFCGKDLDTEEECKEGICFSCLEHEAIGFIECGGCGMRLTDPAHQYSGWCDDCGQEVYGNKWNAKLTECAAEAAAEEKNFYEKYI